MKVLDTIWPNAKLSTRVERPYVLSLTTFVLALAYSGALALTIELFGPYSIQLAFAVLAGSVAASCLAFLYGRETLTLSRRSRTDGLTGVGNRHEVLERLGEEVARSRRSQAPLTLLMVDVDRLKEVNDRWGHQVGDATLRAVADAIRRATRVCDVVGRYGGDEFLVLAPDTSQQSGRTLSQRIVREVAAIPASQTGGFGGSVSVGFATHGPEVVSAQTLLEDADRAMYVAKRSGGGCSDGGYLAGSAASLGDSATSLRVI